jgi:hypothetical protein
MSFPAGLYKSKSVVAAALYEIPVLFHHQIALEFSS